MTKIDWQTAKNAFSFKFFGNSCMVDGEQLLKGPNTIYCLLERIGKGGYGQVWKCKDLSTGEQFAIKLLNQYANADDANLESHLHQLMGTSGGPVIASRFGKKAIVMKLLYGRKLEEELLDPNSKFDPLDLYRKAKSLIHKLHSKGYYHGDTNTGNFIVQADGTVYLIDYGDSRQVYDLEHRLEDFKKLASNVTSELSYREDLASTIALEEARADYFDPERLINDISSLSRVRMRSFR
jgi:serine/threonine protein kinase